MKTITKFCSSMEVLRRNCDMKCYYKNICSRYKLSVFCLDQMSLRPPIPINKIEYFLEDEAITSYTPKTYILPTSGVLIKKKEKL